MKLMMATTMTAADNDSQYKGNEAWLNDDSSDDH
jgi:hypothetical protein